MERSSTGTQMAEQLDPPTPYRKPLRTWAGHGTGAICHGCNEIIQAHEIEYEIELAPGEGAAAVGALRSRTPYQARGEGRSLRFHFSCYRNWTGK
jgi:hypothetical protein